MRSVVLAIVVLSGGAGACSRPEADRSPEFRLKVHAGDHDRQDTVTSFRLEGVTRSLDLYEVTGGWNRPVPVQADPESPEIRYFILDGETPAGAIREFELRTSPVSLEQPAERVEIREEEGQFLEILLRDSRMLRYNYGMVKPPDPASSPLQTRNGYLHPLWTPSGLVVTDDFNPDHEHQRGVWTAWVKTEFEGRQPDFWNLGEGTGTVRFNRFGARLGGPVFGYIRSYQDHIDLSAPGGEKIVISESWTIRAYGLAGKSRGFFLFDMDSRQRLVADGPFLLKQHVYGGLGVRGARDWKPDGVDFLTSGGNTRLDGDGARVDWVAMEGLIGKSQAGIAVFGHPENLRSPQPVRIHPEMPYFSVSPVRLGDIEIVPDMEINSRYRFLVYDGRARADLLNPFRVDFCAPPYVEVLAETRRVD